MPKKIVSVKSTWKLWEKKSQKIGKLIFHSFQNIAQQFGPKNGNNGDGSYWGPGKARKYFSLIWKIIWVKLVYYMILYLKRLYYVSKIQILGKSVAVPAKTVIK